MSFKLLSQILSQPTAPYREMHVQKLLTTTFDKHGVSYFSDPAGNIVVGVKNLEEYKLRLRQSSREPVRLFIAHTDHPGFHGDVWLGEKKLKIKWLGGSPTKHLKKSGMWVASADGLASDAMLTEATLDKSKRFLAEGIVEFKNAETKNAFPDPIKLFGGFRFKAPVWTKGDLVYTKAADDLVGAYCISQLAIDLKTKQDQSANFLGLLTRAEEVGFMGAIAHFELGWLGEATRKVVCVSLEASRALPGAEIGKGPVVRLGDRATVFDAKALQVLTQVAATRLKGKHQRRLMDGGTCEATVATAYGFPAIGISIPLGNYHNQSFEGGPESKGPLGPAPEFVHKHDIKNMLKLCAAVMETGLNWETPWAERLANFRKTHALAPL
jgi:putative aminopeptidase FrvX